MTDEVTVVIPGDETQPHGRRDVVRMFATGMDLSAGSFDDCPITDIRVCAGRMSTSHPTPCTA